MKIAPQMPHISRSGEIFTANPTGTRIPHVTNRCNSANLQNGITMVYFAISPERENMTL